MNKVLILNGKQTSEIMKDNLSYRVSKLKEKGINPTMVIIQVGDDYSSGVYVRNKNKYGSDIDVTTIIFNLNTEDTDNNGLIKKIKECNECKDIHGIIVQLPLPDKFDTNTIINSIDPSKDVDGFTNVNLGKLMNGDKDAIISATPKGIMTLLKDYSINVADKNCLVIGRGKTVGKPLAQLLINHNANVSVVHSKTNIDLFTKLCFDADIIFSCVGRYGLLDDSMLSDNAIVIDAGITRNKEGKLCGDYTNSNINRKGAYSPVPGGVGPMTIASLFENLIECCERI